jgi:hypothetical protein
MFILGEILPDKPRKNKKNPANQSRLLTYIQKRKQHISIKSNKSGTSAAN